MAHLSTIDNSTGNQIQYPHISKSLSFLFCGYVVIWYLQIGERIPFLGSIRFEFYYAALLTTLAFFLTPIIDNRLPLLPYVLLYFILIVIQVIFSCDFNTSWTVFIERIIKFAFMAFFIVSFVRSPKHLIYFLAAFLLACLKMGQEGLVGRITGSMIWENQEVMRLHGSTANYAHPNSFAGMALGVLPFVYYLWPLGNKYIKSILLLSGILSLNIVLYSGSRTGYIGIIAFIIYIYNYSNNKKKLLVSLLLFAALIMPLIPSQYVTRFTTIFADEEYEDGSTKARKEIVTDAVKIFITHPFGVGVSAFPKVRMDTFGRSQDTHNLYLEIATNLGIQGLIIVGALIYKMLVTLYRIRSFANNMIYKMLNDGDKDEVSNCILNDLKLIEAVSLATSAFIIIRLVLGLFGMDLYEIYWWFAIGITMSLSLITGTMTKSNKVAI